VELLGALSIIHFAKNNSKSTGEVYEYCLKEDKSIIDFTSIGDETRKMIGPNLTSFYLFTQLHESVIRRKNLPFRKTCNFDDVFFSKSLFIKLKEFIDQYYNKWLSELSENERSLTPFKRGYSNNFWGMVKGYELEPKFLEGFINRPFDLSDLWLNMALCEKHFKKLQEGNKVLQYFLMSESAIRKSISHRINF
jgi:hypothetical protein